MGRKSGTTPDELSTAERQRQALELRREGLPFDEIAARLGYSNAGGAYKAVQAALRKALREPAEELVELEEQRLDALLAGIWEQAANGDLAAVDRALKIAERRSKLRGLDAPEKRDLTTGGQPIKAYIAVDVEQV